MAAFTERRVGRRIALIIAAAMTLAGVGGLLVLATETRRTQLAAERRLSHALARSIAASFHSFDPRLSQHPAADITAVLAEQEEVRQLDVFDHEGRIRWARDPARVGQSVGPRIRREVMTSSAAEGGRQGTRAAVVLPLRKTAACLPCHTKGPDPLGGIYLLASHRTLFGGDGGFPWLGTGGVLLLVGVVTALLLALLDRLVVQRLSRLVEVMGKAEEGDFMVRAEVRSNDEIALLASTFNKLLAKITDLRVERIDKEREMSQVLDELSLKKELAEKGALLEAANGRLSARLAQLSFLYDLGRDLANQLELEQLFDRLAHLVHGSLKVPAFAVFTQDKDGGPIVLAKARGLPPDAGLEPYGESELLRECLARRQAVWVPDLSREPRRPPLLGVGAQGSLLLMPVLYQEAVVGLLLFASPVPAGFGEEDRELFGAVAHQTALALANAQLFQKTLALSNTDGLTGIANRRAMEARMELEWSRAQRDQAPLGVVMIDIDHFKVYNDQHGHQLGDETLRRVARILERHVRKVDFVARYGGEEFVVILPRASRREAQEVANKLRRSVEQSDFVLGYMQPLGRVTISAGVASAPEDADEPTALVNAADLALLRAKQSGRNQVALAAGAPPGPAREDRAADDGETWNDDSAHS